MSKAPAFQLYAADFYMDTAHWSVDEIGIYTRLLFFQWINRDLPNDEVRLARIAGCSTKRFQKGWQSIKVKFILLGNGQLQNIKMEDVREEQRKYSEKQSDRAKSRWTKDDATAMPRHDSGICRNDALQSSSSTSLKDKELKAQNLPVDKPKNWTEVSDLIEKIYQKDFSSTMQRGIVQFMRTYFPNKNSNYDAVWHSLNRLYEKIQKGETIEIPFKYLEHIFKTENGNYNERDYQSEMKQKYDQPGMMSFTEIAKLGGYVK